MWSRWQHQPVWYRACGVAGCHIAASAVGTLFSVAGHTLQLQTWQCFCFDSVRRRTAMPRIGHEEPKTEVLYLHQTYPPPTDTHSMYSHGKNSLCFKHSSSVMRNSWFGNRTLNFQDVNRVVLIKCTPEYPKWLRHVWFKMYIRNHWNEGASWQNGWGPIRICQLVCDAQVWRWVCINSSSNSIFPGKREQINTNCKLLEF